jgi:hypothetical protein
MLSYEMVALIGAVCAVVGAAATWWAMKPKRDSKGRFVTKLE